MKEYFMNTEKKLDFEFNESGDNISVGQKQYVFGHFVL